MVLVELPLELVKELLEQAKRELSLFERHGVTPEMLDGSKRVFYIQAQFLPVLVAALTPVDGSTDRLVPRCTCYRAEIDGVIRTNEKGCPVHGFAR